MSQENVELVRRLYEAMPGLRDADPADDQAFLDRMFREFLDADHEFRLPPDYPEGARILRGREGMIAFAAMLRDAWSEWRFVPEGFSMLVIACWCSFASSLSATRAAFQSSWSPHIWTIRDGWITSTRIYRDRSEALGAVGLRE